jgi:hypothetical protein
MGDVGADVTAKVKRIDHETHIEKFQQPVGTNRPSRPLLMPQQSWDWTSEREREQRGVRIKLEP